MTRVGFIGFGEAATAFAGAMAAKGANVGAYDVRMASTDGLQELRRRAEPLNVKLEGINELIAGRNLIISTVTTDVALEVAKACSGHLTSAHTFIDMNSTSPNAKQRISEAVGKSGARFVEGAILGAIGATGASTKVLLGGQNAQELSELLNRFGLNTRKFSEEVGKASTFKMIRSVFSKGAEALLIEMLAAGRKAGIDDQLWDDIVGFMESKPFGKIASNWLETHGPACERRYFEMRQVCQTMEEMGLAPVMSCATEQVFKKSVEKGLKSKFARKADDYAQVIDALVDKAE